MNERDAQFQRARVGQRGRPTREEGASPKPVKPSNERYERWLLQSTGTWTGLPEGAAVNVFLEEAQDIVEENQELDYVHAADVLALNDGAEEVPPRPLCPAEKLESVLGDIQAAVGFLTYGHGHVRQQQPSPTTIENHAGGMLRHRVQGLPVP